VIKAMAFMCYVHAWGETHARFYDIGMQAIAGVIFDDELPGSHPKHRSGTVYQFTKRGLEKELERCVDNAYPTADIEKVLAKWPKKPVTRRL
jgi:hypothetical protein